MALAFATKMYPILLELLHLYGLNYYYTAVGLLFTIWGMVIIKDIDQLSLVEIERIYDKRVEKSESTKIVQQIEEKAYGSFSCNK